MVIGCLRTLFPAEIPRMPIKLRIRPTSNLCFYCFFILIGRLLCKITRNIRNKVFRDSKDVIFPCSLTFVFFFCIILIISCLIISIYLWTVRARISLGIRFSVLYCLLLWILIILNKESSILNYSFLFKYSLNIYFWISLWVTFNRTTSLGMI